MNKAYLGSGYYYFEYQIAVWVTADRQTETVKRKAKNVFSIYGLRFPSQRYRPCPMCYATDN